jgi:hypothetical protein
MRTPRETSGSADTKGFHLGRYTGAGLILVCVAFLGYSERNIFRDTRIVAEAFPSIPSDFATELDFSILFSPFMLRLDDIEKSALRWIKYPPLTLPDAPLPTGNPIGDQIHKARNKQGLVNVDDDLPSNGILGLKQSSLEALGRAIYLSQEKSDAKQDFEQGKGESTIHPGFARKSPVEQLRQLFEIAYGPTAARQAAQPEH